MGNRITSSRKLIQDEQALLDEFYQNNKEYSSLDRNNPDYEARCNELRARYKILEKEYEELFQHRSELQNAVVVVESNVVSTNSLTMPSTPTPPPNLALDILFGNGFNAHKKSSAVAARMKGNRNKQNNDNDSKQAIYMAPPMKKNSRMIRHTIDEAPPVLGELYNIKNKLHSLDNKYSGSKSRREFLRSKYLGTKYKESDQAYNKRFEFRVDQQIAVKTTDHEIDITSHPNSKFHQALDIFFGNRIELTDDNSLNKSTLETAPLALKTFELEFTIPCPYCCEQIKSNARKCRYCNEWMDSNDKPENSKSENMKYLPVKDVAIPKTIGGLWISIATAFAIISAGILTVFMMGWDTTREQSYWVESIFQFLGTGPNGIILGMACSLMALISIVIGRFRATPKPALSNPPLQDLVQEQPAEDSNQHVPSFSTPDSIPPSVHEELPKLTLQNETHRTCTECGKTTSLTKETCDFCSYSDASLGIVNSIIAGDTQQVRVLLNVKPTIVHTITGKHEWTLLHMATRGGNMSLVDLLIRRGCNVNAQNIYGKTALHYAAMKGHLQIAKLLLSNNANPHILFEGKTALKHAIENIHRDITELLK